MGQQYESLIVARAALSLAMSPTREAEKELKEDYLHQGIKGTAVDFGGEFITIMQKVLERAAVASKREEIIDRTYIDEGAVIGAAREALAQTMSRAVGLNVGGKVGIARKNNHIVVAVFFAIGLLHLNEVCVGLGHRVI
ncbi:MAG: hut operon positive regulator HutP [Firmicutes bacterium]|nr:hut operon positive regulator HutP [Bacillota bacterium]